MRADESDPMEQVVFERNTSIVPKTKTDRTVGIPTKTRISDALEISWNNMHADIPYTGVSDQIMEMRRKKG